jgi:hypothetical protein
LVNGARPYGSQLGVSGKARKTVWEDARTLTVMGRYSLSPAASKRSFSAFLTDGRTYGFPVSSRFPGQSSLYGEEGNARKHLSVSMGMASWTARALTDTEVDLLG